MSSPLLPFEAHISSPSEEPYRLRMSQGFNEAIWFGSGLAQDPQLQGLIERLMGACNGSVELGDDREVLLSHLMALSWHIEFLVTALLGRNTAISDHQAFLKSLSTLAKELTTLGPNQSHPQGTWVRDQLREAQFRAAQLSLLPPGVPAGAQPHPAGAQPQMSEEPVQRPLADEWNSRAHWHRPLMVAPELT